MGFFKNLFGSGKSEDSVHVEFAEGDVFYTEREGQYNVYKLLRIESVYDTFHVKWFEKVSELPKLEDLPTLGIFVHHTPMARKAFENPRLISKSEVSENDLLGYFEYIKQTRNVDEIVKYANEYYQQAHQLTNQKNHLGAIQKYSSAIDLMPNFFEAIDNRAFCYMDMGKWSEAIEGFKQSLEVNPNSLLAVFSMGECFFRLKQYEEAKTYFNAAQQIDPTYTKSKEFIDSIDKLLSNT